MNASEVTLSHYEANEQFTLKNLECLVVKLCVSKTDYDKELEDEQEKCSPMSLVSYSEFNALMNRMVEIKHLRSLNLSQNNLKTMPDNIGVLRNLLHLDLSYNQLEDLPESLSSLVQLKILDLSHNNFSSVPLVIQYCMKYLRILNLSYNEIESFSDDPSCLNTLMELNLRCNKLNIIPRWMCDSRCKIEELDMSLNPLCKIDENFLSGDFINLRVKHIKVLCIENCDLSKSKINFITNFVNVETLKLGNNGSKYCNYLDSLDVSIFENCTNLKRLDLNNLLISCLSNNLNGFNFIHYLNLERNTLSWLPDSFCHLKSLKICKLGYNMISFLPKQIGEMVILNELYLNNNDLSQLPTSFNCLINLEYCDLYMNKLDHIDIKIVNLKSLKGIDLGYNYLNFEVLCGGEDVYNNFIDRYNALKNHYRQHFDFERFDFQYCGTDENYETASDSKPSTISDSDISQKELNMPSNDVIVEESVLLSEKWDEEYSSSHTDYDSNDKFDRNVNDEAGFITQSQNSWKIFKGNFCPGDTHPTSLRKCFLRKYDSHTVDGQFDHD